MSAVLLDRPHDGHRVDAAGAGEVHLRNDAGLAQSRVEQAEERESRDRDLSLPNIEHGAQQFDLGRENPMRVDGALGGARAAGSKQYRRRRGVLHSPGEWFV